MRTIYLSVNRNGLIRKVGIDMAFLSSHNKIRLPKYYFETGLYLSYKKNLKDISVEEYYLTKDKVKKEDNDFYYFDFPFKVEQVFNISI
jgi:hypothetical protein